MRLPEIEKSVLKLIGLVVLLVVSGFGMPVAAQDATTYNLGVVVVNCDVNPPAQITMPEDGCAPGTGIEFNATDSSGTIISTCIADIAVPGESFTAGCSLAIPFGSTVTVTENMATIPTGYLPLENAQLFTAPDAPPTGFVGGPVFVNMLQDGADSVIDSGNQVNPDGLPDTGSGASAPSINRTLGVMLTTGVILLGVAAVTLRKSIRSY